MKVVYVTNTGSTERYANMLSERLGCECTELSKAEKTDDEVVFFGWVMAGVIQGLAEARTKLGELTAVCAVGMMVGEKKEKELIEKNAVEEEFFFLPGAFDMKKLKGMHKMLMSIMLKTLKTKLKGIEDPAAKKAISMFEDGFDNVNEENLNELCEWLNS